MSEYFRIFLRQLATPIFLIIISLAITLLALGEKQDALFIVGVVSFNIIIGVLQEFRARYKLRQLELMSAPRAKLVSHGQITEVDYRQLKVNDQISLEAGDELPADGQVSSSRGLECDESMLSGESVAIKKRVGDKVYASSMVVAGSAEVKVTAVGDNTRVGMMSSKLKNYDPQITPLQRSIARAIQYFTVLALVLAVAFIIVYRFRQFPLVQIVKTITTAAVTVVPEGLLLASTVFLAYGSLRLAQARVLPQKLSAIESMALIDVLCVDKTGTLTSPDLSFRDLLVFRDRISKKRLGRLLSILAQEAGGNNATARALQRAFKLPLNYAILDVLAFSSQRKMSAVKVKILSGTYTIAMGAPEYLSNLIPMNKSQARQVAKLTAQGLRVLLVAELDTEHGLDQLAEPKGQLLGLVSFSHDLREGVVETIQFLQDNGISIRVISGDAPQTVAYIAKLAGIKAAQRWITGSELSKLEPDSLAWDEQVLKQTIFARVLPEQKEKIIASFQRHDLYVGMVGDGVNDALALKTADLGVAMSAGATASKRVSDLILLDNAFTALPVGMRLGSQIMLSIEMVACLAFHKILFGVALSVLSLLFNVSYPFLPRHVTFMNIFLLTLPTLIITIFTPIPTRRINPKYFWRDTLGRIWPLAALSAVGIFATYMIMTFFSSQGINLHGRSTMTVWVATFFGMNMVFLTNYMFRTKQTANSKTATAVYVACSLIIALISFGWGFARNFFVFHAPNAFGALVAVGLVVIIAVAQLQLATSRRITT